MILVTEEQNIQPYNPQIEEDINPNPNLKFYSNIKF